MSRPATSTAIVESAAIDDVLLRVSKFFAFLPHEVLDDGNSCERLKSLHKDIEEMQLKLATYVTRQARSLVLDGRKAARVVDCKME